MAPEAMSKLMNTICGSDSKTVAAKPSPSPKRDSVLGKRAREEEETPETKIKRRTEILFESKHNLRPPKEPDYYRQLSG